MPKLSINLRSVMRFIAFLHLSPLAALHKVNLKVGSVMRFVAFAIVALLLAGLVVAHVVIFVLLRPH